MTFLTEQYKKRLMTLAGLQNVNESINFTQQDLSKAYDKSWERIQGFNLEMIKQAIREGRAIGISYKSNDMPVTKFRVILPVTLGEYSTKSGEPLKLSAFHLAGQSERAAQKTNKRSQEIGNVWRLFDLNTKSFKGMWFTDSFFYEYPPEYKKSDKRFNKIIAEYDTKIAQIEKEERENKGKDVGIPIDLRNVSVSKEKNAIKGKENNANVTKNNIENNLKETQKENLYLKKPWNKYLRKGFNFS